MFKNKILSIVAGVLAVGGLAGLGVSAAQNLHPSTIVTSSDIQNSIIENAASNSNSMESVTNDIMSSVANDASSSAKKQATIASSEEAKKVVDKSTSGNQSQTTSSVSSKPTTSLNDQAPDRYMLIDPKTGEPISGRDPNYLTIQAELNAGCDTKDAGTVPPDYSVACQAALERIKAAKAADSSTASK